jgi:hypothetical protein
MCFIVQYYMVVKAQYDELGVFISLLPILLIGRECYDLRCVRKSSVGDMTKLR